MSWLRCGAVAAAVMTLAAPALSVADATICPGTGIAVYQHPEEGSYRCDLAAQFATRGVDMSRGIGKTIGTELARQYATMLQLADTAALPKAKIHLLLKELPDAARLINYYKDTRYEIRYLERGGTRFAATNNRNMSAIFTRFETLESGNASHHLLFESGEAKFLLWRFKGSAIIDLKLVPSGDETDYVARLHLFTDSKRYDAFFNSGIFKLIVRSVVRRVIGDLISAANSLIESGGEISALSPSFVRSMRSAMTPSAP
jgi:hypothetical protein